MRKARIVLAVAGVALVALTACGPRGDDTHLMNLHSASDGPDEFAILPPKALQMPADLTALPPPSPGGENLTDQHPMEDAIVALGGKEHSAGGIPASDAGLVNYADRNGGMPGIRASLAKDDLTFRKRHPGKLLERAFGNTTYYDAYKAQWLDAYKELARWRAAGVRTPSAPPVDAFKK
ncbi:DUF3035 domain-containing protein [bacterium]|nr:DUF3035 domain-containing protein [bacterium]